MKELKEEEFKRFAIGYDKFDIHDLAKIMGYSPEVEYICFAKDFESAKLISNALRQAHGMPWINHNKLKNVIEELELVNLCKQD